jgi:hypothetical protein
MRAGAATLVGMIAGGATAGGALTGRAASPRGARLDRVTGEGVTVDGTRIDGGQDQMKDQPLLQALGETREHLLHPIVLVLMLLTSFVLGVSGPFSTYDFLQTGPRILY